MELTKEDKPKHRIGLEKFEFTEDWPDWAGKKPDDAVAYVGVIENGNDSKGDTWFKPIVQMENGYNRRWVYKKGSGKMPYGPDLPPAIEKMLEKALEAKL